MLDSIFHMTLNKITFKSHFWRKKGSTVKPVLSGHSKLDKTKALKPCDS